MSQILYLNEARINKLLNWTDTYKAIEISLTAQCRERAIQNPRSVIRTTNGVLYSMPGFLQNETYGALGCKLVTSFTNNPNRIQPLPSVLAHILLFNEETGELKAVRTFMSLLKIFNFQYGKEIFDVTVTGAR